MLQQISQTETLADKAYNQIKKAIIQGEFTPGDLLREEEISSMLGISRTPLRKAISRLAFEGLVEIENGKIARVAVLTPNDINNFLKLRMVLEVLSAEEAVPFVTEEFIGHLEKCMSEQKKAMEEKDFYSYIDLDVQFHCAIAEVSQNQKLLDFVEQINNQLTRYLVLTGTLANSAYEAYLEHLEIIEALKERDVKKAGESIRKHLENVEKRSQI